MLAVQRVSDHAIEKHVQRIQPEDGGNEVNAACHHQRSKRVDSKQQVELILMIVQIAQIRIAQQGDDKRGQQNKRGKKMLKESTINSGVTACRASGANTIKLPSANSKPVEVTRQVSA